LLGDILAADALALQLPERTQLEQKPVEGKRRHRKMRHAMRDDGWHEPDTGPSEPKPAAAIDLSLSCA
jgi:glutamate formiminotransferase